MKKKHKKPSFIDHMVREKKKPQKKRGYDGELRPDEDLAMAEGNIKPGRGYGAY